MPDEGELDDSVVPEEEYAPGVPDWLHNFDEAIITYIIDVIEGDYE